MKHSSPIKKITQGVLTGLAVIFLPVIAVCVPTFLFLVFSNYPLRLELIKELFQSANSQTAVAEFSAIIIFVLIVMRAVGRIPFLTKNYAEHFNNLPWEPGKPLPAGAFQFSIRVWACIVTTAVCGFYYLKIPWYVFPSVAIATQLTVVAVLFFTSSRFWWLAYTIIGVGLFTILLPDFAIIFAGAAFLLHWPMNILVHRYFADPDTGADALRLKHPTPILWPISQIRPVHIVKTGDRRHEWIAVSIVLALLAANGVQSDENSILLIFAIASCVVAVQTLRYVSQWLSPVPLMGRILKGPLIIPAYDKIFLSWLASSALLILAWIFSAAVSPAWLPAYAGGMVLVSLVIARLLRPTLEDWKLLAPGRLPSSLSFNGKLLIQL